MSMHASRLLAIALLIAALPAVSSGQLAFYDFNNNLVSTDSDSGSYAADLVTGQNGFIYYVNSSVSNICLDSSWSTTTEQGPFNWSKRYFEIEISPNAGRALNVDNVMLRSWGSGTNYAVNKMAVYADEEPGSAGNNFATKLGQVNAIFPEDTYTVDLSGVSWLQGVTKTVTIRIYFWASAWSSNHAEFNWVKVGGSTHPVACGATIGDYVWLDLNGNGIQDGNEPGVGNVAVDLLNSTTGAVLASTSTDGAGFYSFTCVPNGSYKIRWTPPLGYAFTLPDQGSNGNLDSDANPSTGLSTHTINVTSATQVLLYNDAGLILQPQAKIGNFVWNDLNRDGIQDGNAVGVGGVAVNLLSSTGAILANTTTNGSGFYEFCVDAGTYIVEFIAPTGFEFTLQGVGGVELDSNANPSDGRSGQVSVAWGEINHTIDAGIRVIQNNAIIGNKVWKDLDCNGIQNSEPGLPGVIVQLCNALNPGVIIATTTTSSTGSYSFSVPAGTYLVKVVPPLGYVWTTKNAGTNSNDSNGDPLTNSSDPVTVNWGQVNNTIDFGFCLCQGVTAAALNMGPACNLPLDPVLIATPPILGGFSTLTTLSAFPNAVGFLFASLPPVQTLNLPPPIGCSVYVDVLNQANFFLITMFYTDANGAWAQPIPIPAMAQFEGFELIFQVRLCAPGQAQGPLDPDWLSNGLLFRVGCP